MSKKIPTADSDFKGDFGWVRKAMTKDQVVGIFDLVGFTTHKSNKELVTAVRAMETAIELTLGDVYYWAEKEPSHEGLESPLNEILLRSTGDGYVVAFSQDEDDFEAFKMLISMHSEMSKKHKVNLGINKGQNYVLMEMNNFVNIIGWSINYAARALQFAENGQIICTNYIADPIMNTHGDVIKKNVMSKIGKRKIKNTKIELFNYYKKGEFGAQLTKKQKSNH